MRVAVSFRRRLVALVLLVALVVTGTPLNAAAFTLPGGTFIVDGITYQVLTAPILNEPGTVQVGDGINSMTAVSDDLVIPSMVSDGDDDYRVTEIAALAFAFSAITAIDMPEGVTSIGAGAFWYCSLTSVQLPSTLRVIGGSHSNGGAFAGCSLLSAVNLPDGLEVIGERAFYQCYALTEVNIPGGVTLVGPGAFAECTGLTDLTINNGVQEIAGQYSYYTQGAFEGCTSLTEIVIPNSVTSVGAGAFQGCTYIAQVSLGANVQSIGGGVFVGSGGYYDYAGAFCGCSSLVSVILPEGLSELGAGAFSDCWSLESVSVPDTLEQIGEHAFFGCRSLTAFAFPDRVASIGPSAFYSCTTLGDVQIPAATENIGARAFFVTSSMSRIDVEPDNLVYCSVDGVLFNKDKTTLIHYPTPRTGSYVVPAGIVNIAEAAFAGSRLGTIVIPDGVADIGMHAFWGAALNAVEIPDSVVTVGDQAFIGCDRLSKVEIGESVRTIGALAFDGCRALESVVLPLSLERLGAKAFYDCPMLSVLQFNSPTTIIDVSWSAQYWGDITIPATTKIRGYDPSTAKDYATQWGNPFELIGYNPAPAVEGNPDTNRPIVVLVAGLASDTGDHPASPYNELSGTTGSDHVGDPWSYLGDLTADEARSLGFDDVLIMPTAPDYQHASSDVLADYPCIDSLGPLEFNIRQLAAWLEADEMIATHPENPIVLVGHSYGGVISRSMLVSNDNVLSPEIRDRITGIVQFGSPNGGSYSADFASDPLNMLKNSLLLNYLIFHASDATDSLSVGAMREWNDTHLNEVGVPVVRFAGTYLPDVIDVMPEDITRHIAQIMSDLHGGVDNDACTALPSIEFGYGDLGDGYDGLTDIGRDFGGGEITALATLGHAGGLPGMDQTYEGITYRQLVPQDERGKLLPALATAVASLTSARTQSTTSAQSAAVITAESASGPVSAALPAREFSVPAGGTTLLEVVLDAPTTVMLSSTSGVPTLVVQDPDDAVLDIPVVTESVDGTTTAFVRIEPTFPGGFTLAVGLEDGASGDVVSAGVASGGATLTFREEADSYVGMPTVITAEFKASSGAALTGATIAGSARCEGLDPVDIAFRDDGLGADVVADDGVYSASLEFPMAGTWTVRADAFHASAERSASLVMNVGPSIASVPGLPAEAPVWADELLTSYAVDIPVLVSEDGTYTVSASVTDSTGARLGTLTSSEVSLLASLATTVTASIPSSALIGMAPGPLAVGRVRVTRYIDGVDLLVGSAPGLTSAESYGASELVDFSVTLSGPAANPSSTGVVHFTGTAHNTPSTVASVEYSIDGSTTWQPIEALDGAFDSSHEDFEIDLSLPDYVYGIYVRQTGADGVQLPVSDWAGIRFTVDTVAPAQPAGVTAVVSSEDDSKIADVSWFASDPPSDTTSLVSYSVSLDGVEVGSTCGTSLQVSLPDDALHAIAVTPIDLAGNVGTPGVIEVGSVPPTPPITTLEVNPSSPDGDNGWYVTIPEITLSANEPATTSYAWDEDSFSTYDTPFMAPEGIHTLSYLSVDTAENREDTATAVFKVDTVAPGVPAALEAVSGGTDSIDLSWSAATDDGSGLSAYLVYLADDTFLGETSALTYAADGLDSDTAYSFYV
ncbi:MAG TPA: hypothetical protein DCP20_02185, partial [Coriobacteriia bacterium]|nr:hypothetical protein [Coriobacteriia bacterium]